MATPVSQALWDELGDHQGLQALAAPAELPFDEAGAPGPLASLRVRAGAPTPA